MKKVLLVLLLLSAPTVFGQVNFVRSTSQISMFLTSVADLDTVLLLFPKSLTSPVYFDTTKAGRTAVIPAQDFVSAQGKFTIFFNRTNVNGVADSFRVYFKKVHPITGVPARDDSTFIIATASTFANIVDGSQREFIVSGPCKGVAIMALKGDGGSVIKTRLKMVVDFTQ